MAGLLTDGLYLYSHPCAWVVAVGDEDVTALSPEAVNALLAGELGSTLQLAAAAPVMRMAFGTHIPGPFGMAAIDWRYIEHNPAVRVVVSRDWPQRMLVPAGIGHYRNAAGEAYVGPLLLPGADGEGGLLPPRPGDGTGHLLRPDGSGILGEFRQGAAHGIGWCFDDAGAILCRHANGVRLTETGARFRPAAIILTEQGNLAPALAVDFLRQRHIEALLAEDWPLWLQLDADLAALDVDTGLEALYFQAVALTALGDTELALARVTAYLNLAGAEGAQYGSALSLLGRLREPAAAAREERLLKENTAATERRTFCAAAAEQGFTLRGCALEPVVTLGADPLRSQAGTTTTPLTRSNGAGRSLTTGTFDAAALALFVAGNELGRKGDPEYMARDD